MKMMAMPYKDKIYFKQIELSGQPRRGESLTLKYTYVIIGVGWNINLDCCGLEVKPPKGVKIEKIIKEDEWA